MTGTRDLAGLIGSPPDRTVAARPPGRRHADRESSSACPTTTETRPSQEGAAPALEQRSQRGQRIKAQRETVPGARRHGPRTPPRPATVRISVNIPLVCKHWLAHQAREQQRFVSELVMDALDRHGDDASPPSGRAKRVAVPDGTIYNIVLPADDRQRLDDIVARKETTRSALLTETLRRASESSCP